MSWPNVTRYIQTTLEILLISLMGIGLTAFLAENLAAHYPGDNSGVVASWFQGVGTMIAVIGAFLIGERQTRAAANTLRNERSARKEAYLAIAQVAVDEARTIRDFLNTPRLNVLHIVVTAAERNAANAAEALTGIPLHEVGAADAIAAIARLRRQMMQLQQAFSDSAEAVGLNAAEVIYPNNPGPNEDRRLALAAIETSVVAIESTFNTLRNAIRAQSAR